MDFYTLEKFSKDLLENHEIITILFVYNHLEDIRIDLAHHAECLTNEEIEEIYSSLDSIGPNVHVEKIDSEDKFIGYWLGKNNKNTYVYSMAQNLEGIGRRTLIPLLSDYLKLPNISGSTRSSFLSGDKSLMFSQLQNENILLTKKIFLSSFDRIQIEQFYRDMKLRKVILKPNSESASIGVSVVDNIIELLMQAKRLLEHYDKIIVEEYIEGVEIECTVINSVDESIALPAAQCCCDKDYLTTEIVSNSLYSYTCNPLAAYQERAQKISLKCFNHLEFNNIGRFDFRIDHKGNLYLFDITANPTITRYSSTNIALKNYLCTDRDSLIYRWLFYSSFYSNQRSQSEKRNGSKR